MIRKRKRSQSKNNKSQKTQRVASATVDCVSLVDAPAHREPFHSRKSINEKEVSEVASNKNSDEQKAKKSWKQVQEFFEKTLRGEGSEDDQDNQEANLEDADSGAVSMDAFNELKEKVESIFDQHTALVDRVSSLEGAVSDMANLGQESDGQLSEVQEALNSLKSEVASGQEDIQTLTDVIKQADMSLPSASVDGDGDGDGEDGGEDASVKATGKGTSVFRNSPFEQAANISLRK